MGIQVPREKPRSLLLSLLYRLLKLPLPSKAKFKLFLNLEWIFDRLSHEMSFRVYRADNHPVRLFSKAFLTMKPCNVSILKLMERNRAQLRWREGF